MQLAALQSRLLQSCPCCPSLCALLQVAQEQAVQAQAQGSQLPVQRQAQLCLGAAGALSGAASCVAPAQQLSAASWLWQAQ